MHCICFEGLCTLRWTLNWSTPCLHCPAKHRIVSFVSQKFYCCDLLQSTFTDPDTTGFSVTRPFCRARSLSSQAPQYLMLTSALGLPGPTASPVTFLPRLSPAFHDCASACATRTRLSATSCLQSQRAFSRHQAHQRNNFTCQHSGHERAQLLHCQAASGPQPHSSEQDANQLVTQLNSALAQEDYARASQLRDQLKAVQGSSDSLADWREYGCPDWLADRAEKLGFRFPTGTTLHTCLCTAAVWCLLRFVVVYVT